MRAAIATPSFDLLGSAVLDCSDTASSLGVIKRRVSRMATLDLGAAIVDQGYTDADRTVVLEVPNASAELVAQLRHLVGAYAKVLLFLPDGAYAACPEQVSESRGAARMTLLLSGAPTNLP